MHKGALGLCFVWLCACDGGSSSLKNNQAIATKAPVAGVIVVEERQGKRVVDAWFIRAETPASTDRVLWRESEQWCKPLDTASPVPSAAGSLWRDTLFAGNFIEISSRSGPVLQLQAQQFDSAVVYASSERWLDEALPDDARLQVSGSDDFPAFESVALRPLLPMVRELPNDGVLESVTAPIVWQPSGDSEDRVELVVTRAVDSNIGLSGGSEVRSIHCVVQDTGAFSLPAEVQASLPGNDYASLTLFRKRETTLVQGDATLQVIQLSYP